MQSAENTAYRIPLITPELGSPSLEALQWIVENQAPSPNKVVSTFENLLSRYTGKHVLSTNSGTSALHLALVSLGIEAGDEVICSDFTFIATLNAIIYVGAKPILIDAENETWGMAPELLEITLKRKARRGDLPKALILTHAFGHPANLSRIKELCQEYHIWLIEDAAGGLGSKYRGQPLGTTGDIGVLSFNYNKILSTGGGGALLTSVSSLYKRAEYLSSQAKSKKSFYFHKEVGYNYRINGFGAGIGVTLWPDLDNRLNNKKRVRAGYRAGLANLESISWQKETKDGEANFWLNGLLFPNGEVREKVQVRLNQKGIETARLWKPMHQQPVYQHLPYIGNGVGDQLFEKGLSLPSNTTLSQSEIAEVCELIRKACQEPIPNTN